MAEVEQGHHLERFLRHRMATAVAEVPPTDPTVVAVLAEAQNLGTCNFRQDHSEHLQYKHLSHALDWYLREDERLRRAARHPHEQRAMLPTLQQTSRQRGGLAD